MKCAPRRLQYGRNEPVRAQMPGYERVVSVMKHHRPSGILVEMGYVTNRFDLEALQMDTVKETIAMACCVGVAAYIDYHGTLRLAEERARDIRKSPGEAEEDR